MKITQDVRDYAAQKKLTEDQAIQVGLKEKSDEFRKAGGGPLPLVPVSLNEFHK